jgi:hypothetical protein
MPLRSAFGAFAAGQLLGLLLWLRLLLLLLRRLSMRSRGPLSPHHRREGDHWALQPVWTSGSVAARGCSV